MPKIEPEGQPPVMDWKRLDGCKAGGPSCLRCVLPECVYSDKLRLTQRERRALNGKPPPEPPPPPESGAWGISETLAVLTAKRGDMALLAHQLRRTLRSCYLRRDRVKKNPAKMAGLRGEDAAEFNALVEVLRGSDEHG